VCFIGDGVRDPATLRQAQISISLSGVSAATTDTAQIIFMNGSISQLDHLFHVAENYRKDMDSFFAVSSVRSAFIVGGVLFFHAGVSATILISQTALFLGLVSFLVKNKNLGSSQKEIERNV